MYNESYFKNQRQFPRRKIEDFYITRRDEIGGGDFSEKSERTEKPEKIEKAEEMAVSENNKNENIPEKEEKAPDTVETFSEQKESPPETEVFHNMPPQRGEEKRNTRKPRGGFLSDIFGGGHGGGLFSGLSGIFNRFQEDDIILAAVFFIIFNENNEDDILLLLILGVLFFT